jgi:hypothetical protein
LFSEAVDAKAVFGICCEFSRKKSVYRVNIIQVNSETTLLRFTVISGFFVILFGCGGSAKEASAEFDSAKLRTLLDAIRPHITKGKRMSML